MIRYVVLIACVLFVISSCSNGTPEAKLVGTWKIADMAYAGDSVIGTATFTSTNTILLKTIINGKIIDSSNGSYELSGDHKFLTTKIDTATFRFEITKLTKDLLELKGSNKMNATRYTRYED